VPLSEAMSGCYNCISCWRFIGIYRRQQLVILSNQIFNNCIIEEKRDRVCLANQNICITCIMIIHLESYEYQWFTIYVKWIKRSCHSTLKLHCLLLFLAVSIVYKLILQKKDIKYKYLTWLIGTYTYYYNNSMHRLL